MNEFTYPLVADSPEVDRLNFYKKTYLHVAGAIMAFILLETILLKFLPISLIEVMFGSNMTWLFIIGLFWLGSFMANNFVMSQNRNTQYIGLGLYVVLESIIFLPMIYIAVGTEGSLLLQAAGLTLFLFGGLTYLAFTSNADFSLLRGILTIGGFVALGLIILGAIFGFQLGLWFSLVMVVLAGGSILYNTQSMKNIYHTEQYVGAALQLFASIMLMFWYILRILMRSRD
jgi:FtsH-binding integral membrane protein